MDKTEEEQALLAEMAGGDGNTVGTLNEERLKLMNRIGVKADAERADQFEDVNDDDTTTRFVAGELDEDGNVTPAEAPAEEVPPAEEVVAPVAKYKIKVNGVEKELSLEEVLDRAQKADAADDKFQEAARLREEVKNLTPTAPPVKDVPVDDSEELRALARAIQVGDEEEAVTALRKLRGPATPPAPRVDELYRVIDAKLAFNDALKTFETEFSDLVSDPRLERMVMERDAELIAANDKRPYLERYREIGQEVRSWRDSLTKTAPGATQLQEKEARKAAAPAVPPAASGKAKQAAPDEEPEESVAETIAKMRQHRGGPQWLRS